MRLGQLARKLALRPIEIVEFLALNHIQIEEGSNTRLESDHVTLIMRQFAPKAEEAIVEGLSESMENDGMEEPLSFEKSPNENESIPEERMDLDASSGDEKKVEIIKAPKVALSGLKVLGKIDLPEPKQKETQPELTAEDPATFEVEKKSQQEVRKIYEQKKQRPDPRSGKNPIALQREREAKEAQQKRQEQAEREKERRTQNYLKRVKMSPPTKPVKLVKEPLMEMSAQELADVPKTWLGRFIKWLTT